MRVVAMEYLSLRQEICIVCVATLNPHVSSVSRSRPSSWLSHQSKNPDASRASHAAIGEHRDDVRETHMPKIKFGTKFKTSIATIAPIASGDRGARIATGGRP
jgi:hypothetical protein